MAALLPRLRVETLAREIAFEQQALMTADGARVLERRHTAWLAEGGIGALAYSGKLMAPKPMLEGGIVAAIRDALAGAHEGEGRPERFDCALCNLYPAGGESACKFHTDPEHGSVWARATSVVSVGETRRFCFRPLGGGAWEGGGGEPARVVVPLFTGDVVAMAGHCNDDYEHAVLPGLGEHNRGARVSLVFKRALERKGGQRGHSLAGDGRRARRARAELPDTSPAQGGGRARTRGRGGRGGRGRGGRGAPRGMREPSARRAVKQR